MKIQDGRQNGKNCKNVIGIRFKPSKFVSV